MIVGHLALHPHPNTPSLASTVATLALLPCFKALQIVVSGRAAVHYVGVCGLENEDSPHSPPINVNITALIEGCLHMVSDRNLIIYDIFCEGSNNV
ncbi:hypothetical protein Fmac_022447 [Flemingia macrophylla]|uniref:Uncharacterized protein n=1 Tax=Flemingia macrophylla TaxID=520843 RepID=A0ABD1LZS8_9FABA